MIDGAAPMRASASANVLFDLDVVSISTGVYVKPGVSVGPIALLSSSAMTGPFVISTRQRMSAGNR